MDTPRGWSIHPDRTTGRVEVQGRENEQAIVWPVFIPGAFEASAAPVALGKLAAKLWPDVQWESPERTPTAPARRSYGAQTGGRLPAGRPPVGAARIRGRAGDRLATAIFTWVTSRKGTAGYLYAMTAPEADYRQMEDTFARMLASFRIAGAPSQGQQQASLTYVRWQEPRENAFSLEVPTGWKVSGGLFRFASVDVRAAFEVLSPDGKIRITGGDAEIPAFTAPNPTLEMTGFREGSWYSPGYGVNLMVRRYVPGAAFAQEYVTTKVTRGCTEVKLTESRDRPEAVEAVNAIYAQYGNLGFAINMTAGEVAFTCRRDGQPMQGYYFAGTQSTEGYGVGLWHVELLYGYLSASDRVEQAQSVLEYMLKSFQLNPHWVAMQQNITANTSQVVSRTGQEIANIISQSYWNRQGVMDELSRRRSNAILGVEDVIDPVTGREIKVESGSHYYWIDHRGTIVGTDTDTRPAIDLRELIRLP